MSGSVAEPDTPAPNTASLIAAHIRRKIAVGELAEGDALPSEAEMVKRLGVSRPTAGRLIARAKARHGFAIVVEFPWRCMHTLLLSV